MNLKELYQRFRAWQLEPYQFKRKSKKTHQCFNCSTTYEGDYCPVCGQNYEQGPVGWKSDEEERKPLFGLLEPGSIGSFVLQILGRPGYMISDFLKGRKKETGSPIEALYYVATGTLLILSITGHGGNAWLQSMEGKPGLMGICLEWAMEHIDWAVLIQTLLLIIPVWMLFRFAPKHTHHTLKEGFFIQAFMTSLVLVCILLRAAISDWLILLVPLCNFIIYRQLFGYGIWGTLWRTLLCLGIIFYFFSIIMMVAKYAQGEYMSEHSTGAVIAMVIALVVVGVAIMLLGWWIGKRTASKKVA